MTISSPGIGSNLDVNSIVSQLMTVERQPETLMNTKEAAYQAQLSAYGSLKSALSSFQDAMNKLSTPAPFQSLVATPADSTVLTATAGTDASAGNYTINVAKLAQGQALYSSGNTSATTAIGSGAATTLTFRFGTITGGSLSSGIYTGATFTPDTNQATASVTIDSSNDSLDGIRDAINAAHIGVTASIVNDGSGTPYRLVLTDNATGAAKSMKISVSGDAALQNLLAYDPAGAQQLTQSTAAQNASLTVNGIAITSASNTVAGAISGVTLNLAKDNGASTTLSVTHDTNGVQASVQSFVKAYNDLENTISSLSSYDATAKRGAILQGDATILSMQGSMRSVLASSPGLSTNLNSLWQLGITLQADGTMSLDSSKLQTALANNFSDVASVFAAAGESSDSLVNYTSASSKTKSGTYAVNVTTLATHPSITGSSPAALTITTGTNDQLSLTLDGVNATVTVPAGTYTADSLAAQLQSSINGTSAFSSAGISVNVAQSGGRLTIASTEYGSAPRISVTGGSGASDLLGAAPITTAGVDVAGTIDGVPATGSGQALTGATGSGAEGLNVSVIGGATGARGNVTYTQGYAYQLAAFANDFLDTSGAIAARTDGINQSIKDIDDQRTAFEARMTDVEARYRAQFTALDTMMSSMNQTSSFLTQQLAILQNLATQSTTSKG